MHYNVTTDHTICITRNAEQSDNLIKQLILLSAVYVILCNMENIFPIVCNTRGQLFFEKNQKLIIVSLYKSKMRTNSNAATKSPPPATDLWNLSRNIKSSGNSSQEDIRDHERVSY